MGSNGSKNSDANLSKIDISVMIYGSSAVCSTYGMMSNRSVNDVADELQQKMLTKYTKRHGIVRYGDEKGKAEINIKISQNQVLYEISIWNAEGTDSDSIAQSISTMINNMKML